MPVFGVGGDLWSEGGQMSYTRTNWGCFQSNGHLASRASKWLAGRDAQSRWQLCSRRLSINRIVSQHVMWLRAAKLEPSKSYFADNSQTFLLRRRRRHLLSHRANGVSSSFVECCRRIGRSVPSVLTTQHARQAGRPANIVARADTSPDDHFQTVRCVISPFRPENWRRSDFERAFIRVSVNQISAGKWWTTGESATQAGAYWSVGHASDRRPTEGQYLALGLWE